MKNAFLEAGRFNGTHGVNGSLKAECWCDSIEVLRGLATLYLDRAGQKPLRVLRCVPYKDLALLQIEGYDTPEKASALKNRVFYAKREDLPLAQGAFFLADLIGLRVYDVDTGREYGTVKAVTENAAALLYSIRTPQGGEALLPAIPEFVIDVDMEKGIGVRPVKGLFDEI